MQRKPGLERFKSRQRNHNGGISKTHPWYPGGKRVSCSRGCGTNIVHTNTETLISGVWLQLHQNNWTIPSSPKQNQHPAVSFLTPQQPHSHVQEAPMPTAHTTASSFSSPLTPSLPPRLRHKQPVWQEQQPVLVVHQVHRLKQLPQPPICSLNCSNSTNPLKDVKPPQSVLFTGVLDISLPPRKMLPLQKREQYNQVKLQRCEDLGFGGGRSGYRGTQRWHGRKSTACWLLSQEHQVFQELDAQTKHHQTHPRVQLPTTAHGAEHPPGSLNL